MKEPSSFTPPWLDSPEFLALANAWRQAEQVPDIRIAFRNLKAGIAAQWPLSETRDSEADALWSLFPGKTGTLFSLVEDAVKRSAPSAIAPNFAAVIADLRAHIADDSLEPRNRLQGVSGRLTALERAIATTQSEANVLQQAVDYLHLRGENEAAVMLKRVRHQLLATTDGGSAT